MKPKFTLRDLLWLMLVVGLALGWWLSHRQSQGMQQRREAALQRVYANALLGKQVDAIVRDLHLEQVPAWAMPNGPPDADGEVTYYLEEGNLTLRYSPTNTISGVDFQWSDQSVQQRYQATTGGWSEWVDAHSK